MQKLDEIVNFYLNSDTNYALMITGDWGVGKTYYFKNILRHQIEKTPTFEDHSKNYKPILVSLFGLKSVEEIQTEIFLSLYPSLKNKTVKLGASIGKALIKGILHLKNLGEYFDYVSDVEVNKGAWVKITELVICFDDLERLSENLNIEEFIGYVNSLVENENVKVLIIANENKIERKNYFALKEKVVGNSIEFIPDINKSFDSLVEIKFGGFKDYKEFLTERKSLILEIYSKVSNNLRILSFALTYFQSVYSEVSNRFISNKILIAKKDEILLSLLKFSLTISIEYKEGRITFTKKEKLYIGDFDLSILSLDNLLFDNTNNDKNEVDKTYREIFIEKYYPDNTFKFFTSIFDFITGGSVLQFEKLNTELNELYHIQENAIPSHYEVFNQLNYPQVFSLSDKEYKVLTRKMLIYSDGGLYDLMNSISIFHFSARFNNPLNLNLNRLEKRIINGIKNGKSNYKFHNSLDFHMNVDDNTENKEHLLRIRNSALEINQEIDSISRQIKIKQLENLCYENFQEFCEEVTNHNSHYTYVPIFKNINVNKFYRYFLKSDGDTKWQIVRFWSNRYRISPNSELKQEIDFLETLKNKLTTKLNRLPKRGMTNFIFNEHIKTLQISIERLIQTT